MWMAYDEHERDEIARLAKRVRDLENSIPAIRDLAQHPILSEFRKETRNRLKELERLMAQLRTDLDVRWAERNELFAQRDKMIKGVSDKADEASKAANQASEFVRRVVWSVGAGTGVFMFLVGAWAFLKQVGLLG